MDYYAFAEYTIKIYNEEDPSSPREDDNLGTMSCKHGRYNLGDIQIKEDPTEYLTKITKYGTTVLPLYLYDHSGITISTTPFACPWDSDQVGWIHVDAKKVREWFGVKRITPKLKQRVVEILNSEVKEYDAYLRGEIYSYKVEKNGEHIASCGNFYDVDTCLEEAKNEID